MAFDGLTDFIRHLEKNGELARISAEVDSELEIAAIADRVCKRGGPALLFENVRGSDYPVLIGAFASDRRIAMALGAPPDQIAEEIAAFFEDVRASGAMNGLRAAAKLPRLAMSLPQLAARAPCQEVEEAPDLGTLPVLKCWPGDGGRFVTLPLVVTRDPETGGHNMGMYRMQIFDKDTTGMHWHWHKDGRRIYDICRAGGGRMPVAVALGCDPATIYAATAPLPFGVSEYLFAGFLRRAPLELVRCKTCDLMVPASAEFILEGYVDVDEPLREEGPFGDHTGYYSLTDMYPVFHVSLITRRRDPVYPATVVGKPPMEDCFLARATERIFLPFVRMNMPELIDINFPIEGVFHNCVIVSIKKSYPGQAFKVINAIWGMGQFMFTKIVVVVDSDVDPRDYSTVAWKVFNNIDPARDLLVMKGPLDALDHASPTPHFGHKLGVDATRKLPEEGHPRDWPDDIRMSGDILKLIDQRWPEYGLESI